MEYMEGVDSVLEDSSYHISRDMTPEEVRV